MSDLDDSNINHSDEENPHGFLNGGKLNTFKKNKRERLEEARKNDDKKGRRDELKKERRPDKKPGLGKTQKENLKMKPLSMVMPKKTRAKKRTFISFKEQLKRNTLNIRKKEKQGKLRVHKKRQM
jgi:hypothetical protein